MDNTQWKIAAGVPRVFVLDTSPWRGRVDIERWGEDRRPVLIDHGDNTVYVGSPGDHHYELYLAIMDKFPTLQLQQEEMGWDVWRDSRDGLSYNPTYTEPIAYAIQQSKTSADDVKVLTFDLANPEDPADTHDAWAYDWKENTLYYGWNGHHFDLEDHISLTTDPFEEDVEWTFGDVERGRVQEYSGWYDTAGPNLPQPVYEKLLPIYYQYWEEFDDGFGPEFRRKMAAGFRYVKQRVDVKPRIDMAGMEPPFMLFKNGELWMAGMGGRHNDIYMALPSSYTNEWMQNNLMAIGILGLNLKPYYYRNPHGPQIDDPELDAEIGEAGKEIIGNYAREERYAAALRVYPIEMPHADLGGDHDVPLYLYHRASNTLVIGNEGTHWRLWNAAMDYFPEGVDINELDQGWFSIRGRDRGWINADRSGISDEVRQALETYKPSGSLTVSHKNNPWHILRKPFRWDKKTNTLIIGEDGTGYLYKDYYTLKELPSREVTATLRKMTVDFEPLGEGDPYYNWKGEEFRFDPSYGNEDRQGVAAYDGADLIGSLTWTDEGDFVYLRSAYVHEGYRKEGVFKQLLKYLPYKPVEGDWYPQSVLGDYFLGWNQRFTTNGWTPDVDYDILGEHYGQDDSKEEEPRKEAQEAFEDPQGQVMWPSYEDVRDLSYHAVDNHQGFRDERLLDGALGNTQMLANLGGITDLHLLAAHLISKIQRQQALVEGNKRTATLTGLYFLEENGWETEGLPPREFAHAIVDLAEGRLDEEGLAAFLRQYTWAKEAL